MVRNYGKGYRGDSAGHRLNALGVRRGRTKRPKKSFSPGQLATFAFMSNQNRAANRKKRSTGAFIPEATGEEFIQDIPDSGSRSVEAITSPSIEAVSFAQPNTKDPKGGSSPLASLSSFEPPELIHSAPPGPPSFEEEVVF